jgi:hypothetical protein
VFGAGSENLTLIGETKSETVKKESAALKEKTKPARETCAY